MYDYIQRKNDYKLYICKENRIYTKDIPVQRMFNNLLSRELTDFLSREKSTRKYLGFKSKVPIYINDKNLFLCMKSYRSVEAFYINYYAIKSYTYKKKHVYVNFYTNHSMIIKEKQTFYQQIKKCEDILSYIK